MYQSQCFDLHFLLTNFSKVSNNRSLGQHSEQADLKVYLKVAQQSVCKSVASLVICLPHPGASGSGLYVLWGQR